MNLYWTFEKEKQDLQDKFSKGDLHLTDLEKYVLEHDEDVFYAFLQVVMDHADSLPPEIDDLLTYELGDIQIDLERVPKGFFYEYASSSLAKGKVELEEYTDFLTPEEMSSLWGKLKEHLQDPNYHLAIRTKMDSYEAADAILESGRFDLLEPLSDVKLVINDKNRELIEDYLSTHLVPNYLFAYRKELDIHLTRFKLETLIQSFYTVSNDEKAQIMDIVWRVLRDPTTDLESIKNRVSFENCFEYLPDDQKESFLNLLVDRGCIYKMAIYVPSNLCPRDDSFFERVATSIQNGSIVFDSRDMNFGFFNNSKEIWLNKPNIMSALIESGQIKFAKSSPLYPEYLPRIIENIKNHNPNYHLDEFPHIYVEESKELAQLLLQPEYLMENFSFDQFHDDMKSLIIKRVKEGYVFYALGDMDVINQAIEYGNFEFFLKNSSTNGILSERACEILLEKIKSDFHFATRISHRIELMGQNPKILHFYLTSCEEFIEDILDKISHRQDAQKFYTEETYAVLREYFAHTYELPIEHLDKLEKRFGPYITGYIQNGTIQEILKLNDDAFEKLLTLFPEEPFTMDLVNAYYDSLKQYAFGKTEEDVIQIFVRLKNAAIDHTDVTPEDFNQLASVMDDEFYRRVMSSYPQYIDICRHNPIVFLQKLMEGIGSGHPKLQQESLEILHTITDYYIAQKREQYRSKNDMYKELKIPYSIDPKELERKWMIYALQERHIFQKESQFISVYDMVINKLKDCGMDDSLAQDVLAYYLKEDKTYLHTESEIKPRLREVSKVLKESSQFLFKGMNPKKDNLVERLDRDSLLKRVYEIPDAACDYYQFLATLRPDSLVKNVFANEEVYQSLRGIMKKYRVHKMPDFFQSLLSSSDVQISGDISNLAGFMSYFHQIYEDEQKRLQSLGKDSSKITLTLPSILRTAEIYASVSSVYQQFLGFEDARLVQQNKGPNEAHRKVSKNERLNCALEYTLSNFRRTGVTVPSMNEVLTLPSEKKMRVIVGNFTHPSNITHGERTGACMRIGGVGDSLYDFCLKNVNGFHIRFENPTTREYISRVSGFRNGNTVFLNELRYSCNTKAYANQDIIDACQEIAKLLIERSKDSSCPIQNVVVHQAYATQGLEEIPLGISSCKTGLPYFYSDISTTGILLASATGSLVPIDFNKENVPTYLPAREVPLEFSDKNQFANGVNRVHAIRYALENENAEYVEPLNIEDNIAYGILSQDWYVYMDYEGVIHEEYISIDARAKAELEEARKMVSQYQLPQLEEGYQM